MKRRGFIATGVGVSLAGCLGGNNEGQSNNETQNQTEKISEENVSEEVIESRDVALRLEEEIGDAVDNVQLAVNKDGEIALNYGTRTSSAEGLKTEIYTISEKFVEVLKSEDESTSLFIHVDNVQAIVPEPSVKKYYNDGLEKNAFFETVEFMKNE